MTIESVIATSQPLSDDLEISAPISFLVVALCWIGIFTEGYDVGVLGAIPPALATDGSRKLTPIELGALGSYTLFGMLVGGMLVGGTLSDLHGRKPRLQGINLDELHVRGDRLVRNGVGVADLDGLPRRLSRALRALSRNGLCVELCAHRRADGAAARRLHRESCPQWNFYAFAVVAAIAVIATALIPRKERAPDTGGGA
jgi:hypothetical protein